MKPELYLDSGAFSAWTQRKPFHIDDYIAFIKANLDCFDYVINLDVIPGNFGRTPTADEVETSARQSWENYLYMREFGIDSIPVFHMGERFYWLDKMMDYGCDYIGVSPANDRTSNAKIRWMDTVFDHITTPQGAPMIKTHGFAVTSFPMLYRYPWYSADSTSWIMHAVYGHIVLPAIRNDMTFDYSISPQVVTISERDVSRKVDLKHFNHYGDVSQQFIREYVQQCGTTIEQCKNSYDARARVNIRTFQMAAANKPDVPYKKRSRPGFFV